MSIKVDGVEHFTADELKTAEVKAVDKHKEENPKATEEELKKIGEDAVAKHIKDNPADTKELDKAKEAVKVAEKALEDAKGSDSEQVGRLRKERDTAKTALETANKEHEEYKTGIGKRMDTFETNAVSSVKDKLLIKLAGSDADKLAALNKEYDGFEGAAVTEAQITERVTKAATIVNGEAPSPNFFDGLTRGAGEKGEQLPPNSAKPFNEQENSGATVLRITDEEKAAQIKREEERGK